MSIQQYTLKIKDKDLDDTFWARPQDIKYPDESYKYINVVWSESEYTWNKLSYIIYGTSNYFWLLLLVNNISDPYGLRDGDNVRFLRPEYINEVGL